MQQNYDIKTCRITIETGDPEVAMQICRLLNGHKTKASANEAHPPGKAENTNEPKSFLDIPHEIHGTTKQHLYDVAIFIEEYCDLKQTRPDLGSDHKIITQMKRDESNEFKGDVRTYYGYIAEWKNWQKFYMCYDNFSARYPEHAPEAVLSLITKEQPTTFDRSEQYYINLLTYREYFEPYLC